MNQSLLPSSVLRQLRSGPVKTPMIWHHMSSFQNLGMPLLYDVENAMASIITCMAPVARDSLQEYGFEGHEIVIFDNPAPDQFVSAELPVLRSSLRSLIVVSNHPPAELREAATLLASRDIEVTFAGLGDRYGRITPAILGAHDAVITIGKTTQYALAMGVPVYSYDHFGGGGWITEANLDKEWYGNFAGRIEGRAISAQQVADEIESGFGDARAFARTAREVNARRWSLTRQLEALLDDPRLQPRDRLLGAHEARLAALQGAMRDELWAALRGAEAGFTAQSNAVEELREIVALQHERLTSADD